MSIKCFLSGGCVGELRGGGGGGGGGGNE